MTWLIHSNLWNLVLVVILTLVALQRLVLPIVLPLMDAQARSGHRQAAEPQMQSCCSSANGRSRWISHLILALTLVAIFYLVFGREHGATWAFLPILSALVCPLMMFFMMYLMPKHSADAKQDHNVMTGRDDLR